MTVADCDRDLWRLGRRQCPSHEIDCEYRVDLRSACSPPFAVSRYWGIGRRRSSTELRSLNFPGIYAHCTGSLPELGLFGSPVAYAAADPIDGPAEQGGIRSIATRTIKLRALDRAFVPRSAQTGKTICRGVRRGQIEDNGSCWSP